MTINYLQEAYEKEFNRIVMAKFAKKLLKPEHCLHTSIPDKRQLTIDEPLVDSSDWTDPEIKNVIKGSKFLQKYHRIRSLQESKRKYLAITKKDNK